MLRHRSDDAWRALAVYGWPGNVRELQNVMQFSPPTTARPSKPGSDERLAPATEPPPAPPPLNRAPPRRLVRPEEEIRDLGSRESAGAEAAGNNQRRAQLIGMPPAFVSKLTRYGLR
jgi:DNA-binding NtrC family response regulator